MITNFKRTKLILLFWTGACFSLNSQSLENCRSEAIKLQTIISTYHVEPPTFDSAFSGKVFDYFTEHLDPRNTLFNAADIEDFEKFKNNLFTSLNNPSWNFPQMVKSVYQIRLKEFDSITQSYLNSPLDFTDREKYNNSYRQKVAKTEVAKNIKKYLKLRVLSQAFILKDSAVDKFLFDSLESGIRKKVLRNEIARLNRFNKKTNDLDNYITESFLNAIVQCSDPHSQYMSVYQKNRFNADLKPDKLSFGFYISSTENNELIIEGIVPGGAAWNSKKLSKGDLITAFSLPGKSKIEISDLTIEEIDEILTSPENKEVIFYVRKKDGTIKIARLKKTKLQQDDVIVKGYILKGKSQIGYISLPGFYNDFENQSSNGCANDVARECIKFQKENISGLIIDLRNNGGGSIKEAIDLSGIFIDYGPVCQLKSNSGKITGFRDLHRGIAYPGPLIILVNQLSASASEIFAGTMQDYNRAVIVGSRTFGKATAQIIIPCETEPDKKAKPTGFVKITTNKIYRISGKSNQQTGIIPDIELFNQYPESVFSESKEQYSLSNDTAKQMTFTPLKPLPLNTLKDRNLSRQKSNFNEIKTQELTDLFDKKSLIPLDFEGFSSYYLKSKNTIKIIEQNLERTSSPYKVSSSQFDNAVNAALDEFNKDLIESIEKDAYIQEAYNIMIDLIEINLP